MNYFENKVCPKNCNADCNECDKIIKERKALEIIRELFVFEPDKFNPFRWKKLRDIPQEKIDLLKEVLL